MSYDLIVACTAEEATTELFEALRGQLEESPPLEACDVVDMMDVVPGGLDELEQALDDGDATPEDYERYCKEHDLDPHDDESAGYFLATLWGQNLLFVALPQDPESAKSAFAAIRTITTALKLRLHDPQAGADIDPTYADPLPARFSESESDSESEREHDPEHDPE